MHSRVKNCAALEKIKMEKNEIVADALSYREIDTCARFSVSGTNVLTQIIQMMFIVAAVGCAWIYRVSEITFRPWNVIDLNFSHPIKMRYNLRKVKWNRSFLYTYRQPFNIQNPIRFRVSNANCFRLNTYRIHLNIPSMDVDWKFHEPTFVRTNKGERTAEKYYGERTYRTRHAHLSVFITTVTLFYGRISCHSHHWKKNYHMGCAIVN